MPSQAKLAVTATQPHLQAVDAPATLPQSGAHPSPSKHPPPAAASPQHLRAVEDCSRFFNRCSFDSSGPGDVAAPPPKTIQLLALYALEAIEGTRDVAQLAGHITERVAEQLRLRRSIRVERRTLFHQHRRIVASPGPVSMYRPRPDVIEASVTLFAVPRSHPVALRLEYLGRRWRATELVVM